MTANALLFETLFQRFPVLTGAQNSIVRLADLMLSTAQVGGTIFTCGNGGSATDADHIVGELVKGFLLPRVPGGELRDLLDKAAEKGGLDPEQAMKFAQNLQKPVRALSLCSNQALLTAILNDQGQEMVFAQQLFGLCAKGDLLICLSTSGKSPNILAAAALANILGVQVAALTGPKPSPLDKHCLVSIHVPGDDAGQIQDLHRPVYHTLCAYVESMLFKEA